MTVEELWEEMGSEWLRDDVREIICQAIIRLPEEVQDFVRSKVSFIDFSVEDHIGLTMARERLCEWIVILDRMILLESDDEQGQFTVAHEIAHAYLGHKWGDPHKT